MCYPKPGPRCSPHAREQLDAALKSGDKAEIKAATKAWYLTPAGIRELEDQGDTARALKYKATRKHLIEKVHKRDVIKLGIDLDNTTGDFTAEFRAQMVARYGLTPEEALARYPEPAKYQYVDAGWFKSGSEFREAFEAAEKAGVYRHMSMYKDAAETLKQLAADGRVEIHVVTARDKRWRADTLAWLRANHIPFKTLTHTDAKETTDMDIYLDDANYQLQKLRGAGKQIIAYNQLYNGDVEGAPRVTSWAEVPAIVHMLGKEIRRAKREAVAETV